MPRMPLNYSGSLIKRSIVDSALKELKIEAVIAKPFTSGHMRNDIYFRSNCFTFVVICV